MTPNRQRLASLTRFSADAEQPPPSPLDTHICGFPSLFGLMSKSRDLGVKAHGSYPARFSHSRDKRRHRVSQWAAREHHVKGAADCHFDFFFLTDTAIPLVSGAGTLSLHSSCDFDLFFSLFVEVLFSCSFLTKHFACHATAQVRNAVHATVNRRGRPVHDQKK